MVPVASWLTLTPGKVDWGVNVHYSVGCQSALFSLCLSAHIAFIQIEQCLICICCIHHTVLRLMVQRMEANYCGFDQASCALLHAWPHSLLTHNLAGEAFFFIYLHPWSQLEQTFLITECCKVNLTGRRIEMTRSITRAEIGFFFFFLFRW